MSFSLFTAFASEMFRFGSNVASYKARRESAKAQMAALEKEKNWNLGVMEKNIMDIQDRSMLSSWGAGINPMTGSTAGIIAENEATLRGELAFRSQQYDTQIGNLEAQSKTKYLGIFS